jgi:hypothetical protein
MPATWHAERGKPQESLQRTKGVIFWAGFFFIINLSAPWTHQQAKLRARNVV